MVASSRLALMAASSSPLVESMSLVSLWISTLGSLVSFVPVEVSTSMPSEPPFCNCSSFASDSSRRFPSIAIFCSNTVRSLFHGAAPMHSERTVGEDLHRHRPCAIRTGNNSSDLRG